MEENKYVPFSSKATPEAVKLELAEDWQRVMGCWLGKAVGGTLGTPYEGMDGPFELTFYEPVPEKMLANDDLDLQVVWACTLDKLPDIRVDRNILANAWLEHIKYPCSEYAVALRNLHLGIKPPLSGSYDNWFVNNMGAAIRSEIWACLAPRNPKLAVKYAYEDACVDHCNEGVWAAAFLAALQSAAFAACEPAVLLDAALEHLPDESLVKKVVRDTQRWWDEYGDWLAVREQVLKNYGSEDPSHVVMNMAFTVLGWLASNGDFSDAICIATNCGKDTDCTAATVGALMGIISPTCIPEKWLRPIGYDLVLNPEIVGIDPPACLGGFTDLIMDLRCRLNERPPEPAQQLIQSTEPFQIKVQTAFTDRKSVESMAKSSSNCFMPEVTSEMTLAGAVASLDKDAFQNDFLLMRYTIHLDTPCKIRLMFNTPQKSHVWLDGLYQFGREGGSMIPSPHRVPANQFADISISEGSHNVIAAVGRPDGQKADWVFTVADAGSFLWIPNALFATLK